MYTLLSKVLVHKNVSFIVLFGRMIHLKIIVTVVVNGFRQFGRLPVLQRLGGRLVDLELVIVVAVCRVSVEQHVAVAVEAVLVLQTRHVPVHSPRRPARPARPRALRRLGKSCQL